MLLATKRTFSSAFQFPSRVATKMSSSLLGQIYHTSHLRSKWYQWVMNRCLRASKSAVINSRIEPTKRNNLASSSRRDHLITTKNSSASAALQDSSSKNSSAMAAPPDSRSKSSSAMAAPPDSRSKSSSASWPKRRASPCLTRFKTFARTLTRSQST